MQMRPAVELVKTSLDGLKQGRSVRSSEANEHCIRYDRLVKSKRQTKDRLP